MRRRRSNEKRTAEEKREGLTKGDAANAPCAVLKAVGRRPLDKRRSATAIAIFLQVIDSLKNHTTYGFFLQLWYNNRKQSLLNCPSGYHTQLWISRGGESMGCGKEGQREEEGGGGGLLLLMKEGEACGGGGFKRALGVVHEQWLSWMSGGGNR